jgi:mono/diheme cytochrome c family protein
VTRFERIGAGSVSDGQRSPSLTLPALPARTVRAIAFVSVVVTLTACQQRMAHPPEYRPLQETSFFPDRRSSRPLEDGTVHRGQILDDDPLASGLTPAGKQPQTVQILNDDGTPRETKTGAGLSNKVENFVSALPFQVTEADLKRGQDRFQIYCVPCHGPLGNGRGKIVERGYLEPTSFHTEPVTADERALRERQRADNPAALPLGFSRGFNFYGLRVPMRDVPVGYIFEVITRGYGGMPDYESQIPIPDRWRIAAYVRVLQFSQSVDPAKLPPGQRADLDKALGGQR